MDPLNKESSALPSSLPLPEDVPASVAGSATMIPLPTPSPSLAMPNDSQAVAGATLPADDGDLIEKEWVIKAKQIIERTRNDPYQQSEDLTLFKADYMKKRYGKTIKVNR